MVDGRSQGFYGPLVSTVVVAKNGGKRLPIQSHLQQLAHVLFDGFGVRPTESQFQLPAPAFLVRGHPAFPTQLAVREIDQEIRSLLNGQVMVNGKILAELEGFESVDDDFMDRGAFLHHLDMKQKTMTAQTGDVPVDGLRSDLQITGNLPVGHTSGGFHDDLGIEFGAFLPIGGGEGLTTEAPFAGLASEPLDTVWCGESSEEADFLVRPGIL
jgi:hypothetical protein